MFITGSRRSSYQQPLLERLKPARTLAAASIAMLSLFAGVLLPMQSASANTDVTIYVKVVDESGTAPLSGAPVRACYYSTSNVCASSTSGVDGKTTLVLSVPSTSTYVGVTASHSAKVTESNGIQFVNGIPSMGYSGTDVNSPMLFTLKPRYSIEGYVFTGTNDVAHRSGGFAFSYYKENGTQSVCTNLTTGSDGKYTITDVSTTYLSTSPFPCNSSAGNQYDSFEGFSYGSYLSALNVQNSTSLTYFTGIATKNLELKQTGIKVHVTDGTNSLSGVGVRLVPTDCAYSSCWEPQAVTDSNGDAVFAGLTSGTSWKAAYPRYVASNCSGCTPQIDQYQTTVNTVSSTVATGLVSDSLVLTRTVGYPDTPATISGKVVTGLNNTALPGVTVSMNWNAKIGANNISGNATTITDAQGNYSFSNLPYGYTYINISGASGYRNANISKFTSVAGGTTYSNVNFNLRPSPVGNLTYAGTLKTAGGAGAPIANRTIYLNSMGGSAGTSTQTDANGEFSFTGLAEGNYYVNVDVWSDSLYQNLPWSSSNFLLTSNTSSTDLRLASRSVGSSTVTGFVGAYEAVNGESSATGLAGKQIYVSPQGGGQGFSATTGSDGSWSVTGLVAGEKYWVYTSNINYQEFEYPRDTNSFTVPQSGTYNHRMLFKKLSAGTGSLSGRVKNATNYANIQGITVSLYRSLGGVNIPSVVTNAKGEYSFGNLPEGEYYLSLYDSSSQYQVAYNAAGNSTPAGAKYKSAFMTVEIGSSANRVNAMLTPTNTFAGKLSGVIKDERGVLMANASVQVWDPNDSTIGGYASTNSSGEYSITGIPFGRSMNFKVAPPYDLRFEVTSFSDVVSLSEFVPADTKDVQLAVAGLVSGSVAGIPSTGNVPLVWAQLINPSTGVVVASDYVNQSTGVYTIKSVAQGSYYLQFTQMGKDDGYTGGGGGASGGDVGDPVSLKPVYWNGSPTGTINKSGASTISVGVGGRIEKSITMTKGSSLTGELTVATPTGVSKLTGTRWVQATIYQKQSNGEFAIVGYPQGISGYTNSRLEVAGLAAGTYKLKFEDTRKGTNSLAAVWNGGAATLAAAPAITVGSESTVVVDQSMAMAAPEKTADAFNLDDLEAARLAELENQISTSGTLVPGASTKVFVGTEFAGEYVSAVANSTPVALGTWQQVDKDGYILVTIPSELSGNHRIAVQDVNQQVIGWTPVTIADTNTDPWAVPSSRRSSGTVSDTSATPSASAPSVASAQLGETVKTEMQGPIAPGIWWIAAGIIVLLLIAAGLGIWLFVTRRRP